MKSQINICIAVLALTLVSCLKNDIVYDTDNLEFRTMEFAGPIAKVHAPLYESIKKWMDFDEIDLVDIDGSGRKVICVRYTHSETIEWEDEIGINDYNSNEIDWPPYDLSELEQIPMTSMYQGSKTYQIPLLTGKEPGNYVSDADFYGGTLDMSITMPSELNPTAWSVVVSIPEMKKDNIPFSYTFTHNNPSPLIENLREYKVSTNNKNLNVHCEFTVEGSGISGTAKISGKLLNTQEKYMKGYFGQTKQDVNMEMEFDFFDELDFDGTVGIKDIVFEAKVTNTIGVPLKIEANNISFINKDGGSELTDPFDLDVGPAILMNTNDYSVVSTTAQKGPIKLNEILFEKGKYPTGIEFDFSGIRNPDDDEGGTNFIVKDVDKLNEAQLTLTVPLHIKVEAYNRKDTLEFDYNDLVGNNDEMVNNVEYVYVNLLVDNGLPFDIKLEATAITESGVNVSTILRETEISSNQEAQSIKIELVKDQLEQFRTKEVKYIVLHSRAQTANENYVKVYEKDYLDIAVSLCVKADIPSNINQSDNE